MKQYSSFLQASFAPLMGLLAFFGYKQEGQNEAFPWWFWLLIILLLLALVIWWIFSRRPKPEPTSTEIHLEKSEPEVVKPAAVAEQPVPAAVERAAAAPIVIESVPAVVEPAPASTPVKADDLKVIEGIGPKISGVLQAAGIRTFAELAAADPKHISEILLAVGLRLADPTTWPEQARLAAEGKWDEFKALTDSLKGGKRVA
jgi:predicted flap endonuclease-1-like 5' DNA nuclease